MQTFLAIAFSLLYPLAGFKPAVVHAEMLVQACFSPAGECSNYLLDVVDGSDRELLVAMYAFTSVTLARALVRASARGVDVRVILDVGFDSRSSNSVGPFLAAEGIPVAKVSGVTRGDLRPGSMHQKFVVVDGATVASGSYNWTHAADDFNHENLLIFRNAGPLAHEFRTAFLRLWNERH